MIQQNPTEFCGHREFEWDHEKSNRCYVARVFVVIFTTRFNAIRIISARKANQREMKQYEKTLHED